MVAKKLVLSAITGVFGIILLIGTIQNWSVQSQENEAELRELTIQLNAATNTLVNECLKSLPAGDPGCNDLREKIGEACQTTNDQLDVCNDDRIGQYYRMKEVVNTSTSTVTSKLPSNMSVVENDTMTSIDTVQPDFRCFQRINTMIDIDEDSWYGMTMYNELDAELCERDYTGVQYGVPMKLDILRADQDIEIDAYGNENPLYTEYRLLNGTVLAFGEKESRTLGN